MSVLGMVFDLWSRLGERVLTPSPGRMSFAYPSMQMQADSAPGSSHGHPRVR